MPSPTLRFIHAANVFLDSALWVPGEFSAPVRDGIAVATQAAFRNVVQACLDRDVDFVLLCGNTFAEEEHTLAARVVLRDGLEQLDAAGIPVFVLPGTHDPADAWRSIPELPGRVTVCDGAGEPVDVAHAGEIMAVIGTEPGDFGKSPGSAGRNPLRVGLRLIAGEWFGPASLVPCAAWDYLALGGAAPPGTLRTAAGIVHHPGTPQPLSPVGANGSCTLVEVDESREMQLTSLPTAPIRFEHLTKTLDDGDTPDNLLQTLPGKLAQRPAVDREQVRWIRWTFDGGGRLWSSLQSPAERRRIERELSAASTDNAPAIMHHIELARSTAEEPSADGIVRDFQLAFADSPDAALGDIERWLDELAADRPDWKPRLDQLAARVCPRGIVARANSVGRQRLEQSGTEGLEA